MTRARRPLQLQLALCQMSGDLLLLIFSGEDWLYRERFYAKESFGKIFQWNIHVKVPIISFKKNIFQNNYFVTKNSDQVERLSVMEDGRSNSQFMTHAPIPPSIYIAYHDHMDLIQIFAEITFGHHFYQFTLFLRSNLKKNYCFSSF